MRRSGVLSGLVPVRICASESRRCYREADIRRIATRGFRMAAVGMLLMSGAGCTVPTQVAGVKPYRMEIQQGNFISQEMIGQLKQGMTKEQVRFALGTPLLTDIFHADRWDYVFYRDMPDGRREQRKVAVFFEGGLLLRIGGDVVAADKQDNGAGK
jgi:outer membrane protein assembly factor BamE